MASIKCKFCGGDVEKYPDSVLGVCSSCGSTVTIPKSDSPQRIATHNAGNYFRRIGSFEKALALYQQILEEDRYDAEASWGSTLCRYGIRYELNTEDGTYSPVSHQHPSGSILEDGDYLAALANSEGAAKLQYEREASRIAQLLEPTMEVPAKTANDSEYLLKQAYMLLEQKKWDEADACCDKYLTSHHDSAMAWLGKLLAETKRTQPKDLIKCSHSFEYSSNYQNALKYADPKLRKTLQSCLAQIKKTTHQRETEEQYQKACAAMKHASTEEQYQRAAALFSRISGFRDSNDRLRECLHNAEIAQIDAIYLKGVSAASNARTAADFRKAVELLERTRGWRDTDQRITGCIERLEVIEAAQAERNEKAAAAAQKFKSNFSWKKALAITASTLLVLGISGYLLTTRYIIPERNYKAAEALLAEEKREAAIDAFRALNGYKDSYDRLLQIQTDWYASAEEMLYQGDFGHAAAAFGGLQDFADARERSLSLWDSIASRPHLCAGGWYTAGLKADGTVAAIGDNRDGQCEVQDWQGVTAIGAGWSHTVGLKPDGTVIAEGYNGDGRGEVDEWNDIVSISAGQWHTVGLKINGTVVGTGCNNDGRIDFDGWKDIIAVSAGRNHTVGLGANKMVIAAGSNEDGQCNLSGWTNIIAVSAGGSHTLGLKEDGTVFATGSNEDGQCQVSSWDNIVAVAAGYYHSVGLRADGTVVAIGLNEDGQCDVGDWKDIVAIAAGGWHTVGIKADGTVVAVGRDFDAQCDVDEWTEMKTV